MSTQPKERYVPPPSETSVAAATTGSSNLRTINGSSVLIGRLPEDFLRLDDGQNNFGQNQIDYDKELAASLQQQYDQQSVRRRTQWASQYQAHLTVTFVEARLVKNYGLINMNPYVRFRIGHTIFETKSSFKGGKNPKWNESFRCHLEKGLDHVSIEIYDECFMSDELIAWTSYKIPERFCQPQVPVPTETYEEIIPLTGKQGDGKEGDIFMVFTFKPITTANSALPITSTVYPVGMPQIHGTGPYVFGGPTAVMNQPVLVHQNMQPATSLLQAPSQSQQQQQQPLPLPPQPVKIRDEDVQTLREMFPSIEPDVINSVLVSERGNLDRAINNLLELSTTT